MRCLILGGDGYLGWPTAMHLNRCGHEVMVVDNYMRRRLSEEHDAMPLVSPPLLPERCRLWKAATGLDIQYAVGDAANYEFLSKVVREFEPDSIIHYAEQRSAPFSMKGFEEAQLTLINNLSTTLTLTWVVMKEAPNAHIIKLGTMGEYGTPNIDIEEGWLDVEHNGRRQKFLYPRQGSSLYHTTKIHDTDMLWFYVRMAGLKVTDLMQGPVYGIFTDEVPEESDLLPVFDYDDIFGTVINRFATQCAVNIPLTVYGTGQQTRGFLNLRDTLQSLRLVTEHPAKPGEMRILNQFTEKFSIIELAHMMQKAADDLGVKVEVAHLDNPRIEEEKHYYNPACQGLTDLGLKPTLLTEPVLHEMIQYSLRHADKIRKDLIMPRVRWASV